MDYRQAELSALAAKARQLGTSYGKLVASTTPEQQREITRSWVEHRRRSAEKISKTKKVGV